MIKRRVAARNAQLAQVRLFTFVYFALCRREPLFLAEYRDFFCATLSKSGSFCRVVSAKLAASRQKLPGAAQQRKNRPGGFCRARAKSMVA